MQTQLITNDDRLVLDRLLDWEKHLSYLSLTPTEYRAAAAWQLAGDCKTIVAAALYVLLQRARDKYHNQPISNRSRCFVTYNFKGDIDGTPLGYPVLMIDGEPVHTYDQYIQCIYDAQTKRA